MKKELEKRYVQTGREIVVDPKGGNEARTIGGYAVKYRHETLITTRDGDEFIEEILPGAFDKSIKRQTQKALWNHDYSRPLGSCKAGTLRFIPSTIGLRYEVDVPNNTWGNDAYESVQRGDVDGSSFGFRALDDVWSRITHQGKEMLKRSIIKAELFEVSPCTNPAYDSSYISCINVDEEGLREKLRLRNKIAMSRK